MAQQAHYKQHWTRSTARVQAAARRWCSTGVSSAGVSSVGMLSARQLVEPVSLWAVGSWAVGSAAVGSATVGSVAVDTDTGGSDTGGSDAGDLGAGVPLHSLRGAHRLHSGGSSGRRRRHSRRRRRDHEDVGKFVDFPRFRGAFAMVLVRSSRQRYSQSLVLRNA